MEHYKMYKGLGSLMLSVDIDHGLMSLSRTNPQRLLLVINDDETIWLANQLPSVAARIINKRAHDKYQPLPEDKDDQVIEKDFAASAKPRKKRAERLNDETDAVKMAKTAFKRLSDQANDQSIDANRPRATIVGPFSDDGTSAKAKQIIGEMPDWQRDLSEEIVDSAINGSDMPNLLSSDS